MITVKEMSEVRPEKRQVAWQALEFYGFIHFGMNTMTDREWGAGDEPLSLFNPESLDCHQWVKSLKKSGMKGIILTCKHHDGFCLWPSETTKYTVANTPWKEGKGDIVKEFSIACQSEGLKFGIYLSPWDRNAASYGTGPSYDDLYVAQLTELLTNYGDVFEVWFDGANGEAQGKQQRYQWARYFSCVRQLQPNAVMAICGPDVRWIGNEAGETRPNEWSVVPKSLTFAERTIEKSQKTEDGLFGQATSSDIDLGSREVLENTNESLIWYPAEVNTSIRPGWFYHAHEDDQVKSSEELFSIYKKSVGGNATFLLNVPPMKNGLISSVDQKVLTELGKKIDKLSDTTLLCSASICVNEFIQEEETYRYVENHHDSRKPAEITISWPVEEEVSGLILQEDITQGQQVEGYEILVNQQEKEYCVYKGQSIGAKKILTFPKMMTNKLTIRITKARGNYTIKGLNVISEG